MNDIQTELGVLIKKLFNIDMEEYSEEDKNKPFTSSIYGFHARNLLYLFFEVEKKFNIKILESDIDNFRFDSFNNILKIIEFRLGK